MKPSLEEMKDRIQADIHHYGGVMPERNAIAWYGYLAALIEWQLIKVDEHAKLVEMLPVVEDNPSMAILLGRSGD